VRNSTKLQAGRLRPYALVYDFDRIGIIDKSPAMAGLQCHAIKIKNCKYSVNEFRKLGYERWLIYQILRFRLLICPLFGKVFHLMYRAFFKDAT